jgi:superoxide reductase
MKKERNKYECKVCGYIVEVVHAGAGTLCCCETPMKLVKKVPLRQTKKIA